MAANIASKQFARLTVSSSRKRLFSTVVDDNVTRIMPSGAPPRSTSALKIAAVANGPRTNWTKDEIREIYNTPLMELAFQSVSQKSQQQAAPSSPLCRSRVPSTAASTPPRPCKCAPS